MPLQDLRPRDRFETVALLVAGCGALARLVRYLANRSLWADEGSLAVNLLERSFAQLATPLDHSQAAPLLWLWLQKAVTLGLGDGERALRLLPLLAGLASLPVFWRVARELLERREAFAALALFALCEPLVYYASEFKPYSSDALVCLLVLWPALRIAARGASPARLLALAAAGTVGSWLSLPAIFACAGVGAVLLARLARSDRSAALALCAIGTVWLASFAAQYRLLLAPLRDDPWLMESWAPQMAPLPTSWQALAWYRRSFFGFFNDPLGFPSVEIAALLFAVGLARLSARDGARVALVLAPVAGALLASLAGLAPFPTSTSHHLAARVYPFVGRLLLFGVPGVLLVLAAGLVFVGRFAGRRHFYLGSIAGALLLAAPGFQMLANLLHPPRFQELASLMPAIAERAQPGDRFFAQQYAPGVVAYYLARHGLGELSGELTLERSEQLGALLRSLAVVGPGERFWLVTLHHPHWRSEAEERALAKLLGELAEPLDRLDGRDATARLYRRGRASR